MTDKKPPTPQEILDRKIEMSTRPDSNDTLYGASND